MKVLKVKANTFTNLRLRQGFTLKRLAKSIGIHHTTLSRLENNQTNIRPQTALKITKALNSSFDELFEVIDESQEKTKKEE